MHDMKIGTLSQLVMYPHAYTWVAGMCTNAHPVKVIELDSILLFFLIILHVDGTEPIFWLPLDYKIKKIQPNVGSTGPGVFEGDHNR